MNTVHALRLVTGVCKGQGIRYLTVLASSTKYFGCCEEERILLTDHLHPSWFKFEEQISRLSHGFLLVVFLDTIFRDMGCLAFRVSK